ncbi:MAG: MFS transporter [bacterium]|nr:MFS transporter [bacterium]
MIESPHLPHITRTLAYYAAFIGFGLTLASLGPTLPGLAEQTKSHMGHISTLFIARSLGYLLGILVCGRLYDHVSGHPVLALCLLTIAGTLALMPSLPSLWFLIAAMFLLGTAEGMIEIGGNTLLIWNHPENLAPFMNGLHFFFGVGAFLSPLIIAQAIGLTQGIAWAYWILALLIAPIAIWILFLPSPQIQTPPETHATAQIRPSFIILVGACFFVFVGAEAGIGGWIYTYAFEQNLATETSAAYLTSGFWGAFTVGRLIAIPISSKLPPQTMLLTDILGAALSVGLILLFPTSLTVAWIGTLGAGLFIASMFATLLTFVESRVYLTARITGWFFVGSSLGGMTVPWLIGQLFESTGPRMTMVVVFVDLIAALLFFLTLLKYAPVWAPSKKEA